MIIIIFTNLNIVILYYMVQKLCIKYQSVKYEIYYISSLSLFVYLCVCVICVFMFYRSDPHSQYFGDGDSSDHEELSPGSSGKGSLSFMRLSTAAVKPATVHASRHNQGTEGTAIGS